MASSENSTTDITITKIEHRWCVDELGDLGDSNPKASFARYASMIEDALEADYPDAEIWVKQSDFTNDGDTRAWYTTPDGEEGYARFGGMSTDVPPEAERFAETVRERIGKIWESGKWLVDWTLDALFEALPWERKFARATPPADSTRFTTYRAEQAGDAARVLLELDENGDDVGRAAYLWSDSIGAVLTIVEEPWEADEELGQEDVDDMVRQLNEYEAARDEHDAHNPWNDLIHDFAGFDGPASDRLGADQRSDVFVIRDGADSGWIVRYREDRGRWEINEYSETLGAYLGEHEAA